MLRTLFGKFLIVLLAFGLAMTVIAASIIQLSHRDYHLELDQRAARSLAGQIASQISDRGGTGDATGPMAARLARLAAANTGVDLYAVDARGKVLAASIAPGRLGADRIDMEPVRRLLRGDAALPILGVDPSDPSREDVFSAAELPGRGNAPGYVYALVHRREHQPGAAMIRTSYLLGEGLWIVAAAALFAIGSSLVIARMLTRRLGQLSRALGRFRHSGFTRAPQFPVGAEGHADDELDQLSHSFAEMAQRIVQQMQELQRMDSLRREQLVAISDDLRSPIVSMQHKLRTLSATDASLTAEDRREYLEGTAMHVRRMAKLVSKLFEAAQLDARKVTPKRQGFALPDVVREVMQKFLPDAAARGVRLEPEIAEHLPPAYGDAVLIERAFDNLVESALHRTAVGGAVGIRIAAATQSIVVEVSDTGGENPTQVLERFFEGDDLGERARPGANAGVELAILKEVLELHGTKIRVDHRADGGTILRFTLPARSAADDTQLLRHGLTGAIRLRRGTVG